MDRAQFDERYTAHLNKQQQEAVHAVDGAILLLAVPGSGKTTVLVTRLGYMLLCCGIAPEQILTMTYTVAATKEMTQRFVRLFGDTAAPEFRTINGVCAKIIDYYSYVHERRAFSLLDDDGEVAKLLSSLYHEQCGDFATPSTIKDIRRWITYVKNQMLAADEIRLLDTGIPKFPELFDRYCASLRALRRMDYDDQMVYAKTILERHGDVLAHFREQFPYLCVDESQDTSKIQHAIIRLLTGENGNLFMVGDEDQSIYGFRAAYPEALMRFEESYPNARVLLMEENFRSTPEILQAADAFIRKSKSRHPKTIRPTRPSGTAVEVISAVDRAAQYAYLLQLAKTDECPAVLYRNNDSALPLLDLLDRQGLVYRCRQMDDTFFTNRIVMDVTDMIHFAQNGHDTDIFLRIYFKLGSGISRKAAETACEQSRLSGKPILEELVHGTELSPYAHDRVVELLDTMPLLLECTAEIGLIRIWRDLRYGGYVEQMKLDANKFTILRLLARQEENLGALLARLRQLRTLVATPRAEEEKPKILLSTVHSSKGLEYDTVYLLDVVDGILPPNAAPADPEELRQYEEERRLFYVAMTRAKNRLYLFRCRGFDTSFVSEIMDSMPKLDVSSNDLFFFLQTDLLGKRYCHRTLGTGSVAAYCDSRFLIAYENGQTKLQTLPELLAQRAVEFLRLESPQRPSAEVDERILLASAYPGRRVVHITYGQGRIVRFQAPYVEIAFDSGECKTFDLLYSIHHKLLSYSEYDV